MRLTTHRLSWVLVVSLVGPAVAIEPNPAFAPADKPGESIVACGQKIPIGTRVILWTEPGGLNAYTPKPAATDARVEKAGSLGFRTRRATLTPAQKDEVEKNGMTLPVLREVVDQFVIHYDVAGTSRQCYDVLCNRNLAVQFMLDLDGTIYQTLDLKEAAYHATKANDRSIGIEIANMGAYSKNELAKSPLPRWYKQVDGKTEIQLPNGATVPTHAATAGPLRPSRNEPIVGTVQGRELTMYDLTPQQYDALAKLTAGLCSTFPKIRRDLPRDEKGQVLDHKLDDAAFNAYHGILGHFHVQANKTDPGPAFQWDRILEAR